MNKLFKFLISPITMAALLIIGIVAMAIATFIENDFGAGRAREVVYNAKWFEILLFLFCVNLLGSIFYRKLYVRKKLTIFIFHLAFIVMIIGAAITRYYGFEGMMHIREGSSSSYITTQTKGLNIDLTKDGKKSAFSWNEKELIKKSGFEESINFENKKITLKLKQILPSAYEKPIEDANGEPIVGFVLAGKDYRGNAYLKKGESKLFGNNTVAFGTNIEIADINFTLKQDTFYIQSKHPIFAGGMAGDKTEYNPGTLVNIVPRKLYQINEVNIVVQELYSQARIIAMPVESDKNIKGKTAYIFNVIANNQTKDLVVWEGTQNNENITTEKINNISISASYGLNKLKLPFTIHLDDFEVTRYPGSNSPSSFSSYVRVIKEGEETKPFHIYMNNILKMDGFRFYQSSYDQDEKGSFLSVNFDGLGTTVTYIGYFLLFLGILVSMFNKNSFLFKTHIPKSIIIIGFLWFGLGTTKAQSNEFEDSKYEVVDTKHAKKFGELLIQDHRGRTEPVYTFASDLIRKISRKEKIYGLKPSQLFLEMSLNPSHWMNVPLIKVSNKELQKELNIESNYAAYNDLIIQGVGYKLRTKVEEAYNKAPVKRTKYDKEIIKVDERLNICYSVYYGFFLKVFPVKDSEDNKWHIAEVAAENTASKEDSTFLANIIPIYFQELTKAKQTGNYKLADEYLGGIFRYQKEYSNYELPSEAKTKLEVKYHEWNIFQRLFKHYTTWGIIFLFVLIGGIISGKPVPKWLRYGLTGIILLGFISHIIGLAVRWYISGHAPMSNGYESLIFISGITMLAGFIFSRQSLLALSATSILAGFTLMVANLSFMDPEITNLVPVLKSYWLTIHVSVITGSYGFLGLGFLLGLINQILFIFQNKNNYSRIDETIETLTKINHRTLILGLYFLTIGTFLGAIWANESWGRYWGWDPKETWSLITMLVYTVATHFRMIPGLRGRFAFNIVSVYAFFSVLMTYFGVNYYLSGLHSYAAGDPIPIPNFVYISVISLFVISIIAWNRFIKQQIDRK